MASIKPLDGGKHVGRSKRDLTGYQWHAASVKSATQGPSNLLESDDVIDVAATTADAAGIIDYPGNMLGKPTSIITAGRGKLKMTGTGQSGDSITIEDGKGGKADEGDEAYCRALADWADGDITPVYIDAHIAGASATFTPDTGVSAFAPTPIVLGQDAGPVGLTAGTARTFGLTLAPNVRLRLRATTPDTNDADSPVVMTVSDGVNTKSHSFYAGANEAAYVVLGISPGEVVITLSSPDAANTVSAFVASTF